MCLERIPQGTGLGKESVVALPLPRQVRALLLPQVRPLRQRVGPWTNELTPVDSGEAENQMVNQAAFSPRSLGFSAMRSLATLGSWCHGVVSLPSTEKFSDPVISSDSRHKLWVPTSGSTAEPTVDIRTLRRDGWRKSKVSIS